MKTYNNDVWEAENSPWSCFFFPGVQTQTLWLGLVLLVLQSYSLCLALSAPPLFYVVQSVQYFLVHQYRNVTGWCDLICWQTYLCTQCESPPLLFHGTVWWVQHPLSETVCRYSLWSIRAGNAPSRDRCLQLEQSFSCPGSAPIWQQVEVCWVGTWKTRVKETALNYYTDKNTYLMLQMCQLNGYDSVSKQHKH